MPDANLSAGATEQTSPTSQPNAQKSENAPQFTEEQTAFVQNLVRQALKDQAKNSQFADKRREAEGKQKAQPDADQLTLRQQVADLTAWKTKAERDLRTASVKDAVAKAGLTGDRQDLLLDHVLARHGDKIKVGDDGQAFIVDGENVQLLSEYAKGVVSKNDLFKPVSNVPQASVKNSAGIQQFGGRTYSQLTQDELSKIPLEEQQKMAGAEFAAGGFRF